MKDEFIKIFTENIKREGSDKLLEWLMSSDFFTAPASSKRHAAYEGGLVEHSLHVYKRLVKLLELEYGKQWQNTISLETATIISLLHDVCKINTYVVDYKNVKKYSDSGSKADSNGKYEWVTEPYFSVNDQLPYGHGEKSVYIINGFMRLTRNEAMAINWHMGGFDSRVMGGASYYLSNAFYSYPEALLLHIADMQSTYLDEESLT